VKDGTQHRTMHVAIPIWQPNVREAGTGITLKCYIFKPFDSVM